MSRLFAYVFLMAIMSVACAHESKAQPMQLGVTTHFSQGWPLKRFFDASAVKAMTIRDSINWRSVESSRGVYNFTAANSGYVKLACDAHMGILLGLEPRNPLYDGGQTITSDEGRAAFARYILAIVNRFPKCIEAIEIGNEINGRNGMVGPAANNRAVFHTALLKTVFQTVKPTHPELSLLGGSSNTIPTGFLIHLFEAGALDWIDGLVIHPYRSDPVNLDWEVRRLTAAIRANGHATPIWATEFSREFLNPADAPDFLAKSVILMNTSGISRAFWYALYDQSFYPTMGLFTTAGFEKPSGRAFSFMSDVLAHGQATRVHSEDSTLFHFRLGPDRQIIWGARRAIKFSGAPIFRDTSGQAIKPPTQVSEKPFIIEGTATITYGPVNVLADSLAGYGQKPWRYFAQAKGGSLTELVPIDAQWQSYIGSPSLPNVTVNQRTMMAAGNTKQPVMTISRYTAAATGAMSASACLIRKSGQQGAVTFAIDVDGKNVRNWTVTANENRVVVPVTLKVGQTLDFKISPDSQSIGATIFYRYRITRALQDAATC